MKKSINEKEYLIKCKQRVCLNTWMNMIKVLMNIIEKNQSKIQLKESKDYKRNYMNQRLKVYKLYKIRYLIIIHHY